MLHTQTQFRNHVRERGREILYIFLTTPGTGKVVVENNDQKYPTYF